MAKQVLPYTSALEEIAAKSQIDVEKKNGISEKI